MVDRQAIEWISTGNIEAILGRTSTTNPWPRSGNATHGFMDLILMMGIAGGAEKADYVDNLDLFHTMEAYFTWYPKEKAA